MNHWAFLAFGVRVVPGCVFPRFSIIFPGIREIRAIRGQVLSESFFHPGTGPGAASQVVIEPSNHFSYPSPFSPFRIAFSSFADSAHLRKAIYSLCTSRASV